MKIKKEFNTNIINRKADFIANIMFILISLSAILPFVLIFIISITDEGIILANGYSFIPQKLSLDAYRYLFSDSNVILRAYGVTIFVTVVGTILSTVVTGFYAYSISRKTFRYRKFFTFFVFFTMLFSGGLIPSYILITKYLHLQNTLLVLILPLMLNAWNVIIMRTFFTTSVPDGVIESAKIDGAGELRIFFRIVFPLAIPVFATIALFNCLAYWNDWYLSLLYISNAKLVSLQFLMYRIMRNIEVLKNMMQFNPNTGVSGANAPSETIRMAMAIIAIGPILIAYPFFQKYFVKGLTIGGIKE